MWRMEVRKTGILWRTLHLIPTARIMQGVSRLCVGDAEDVEVGGGEVEAKAWWAEVEVSIHIPMW